MSDTKEKILTTALGLFAQNGYDATSVSMIAEALSITKGALYRHYQNKRAIFDAIVGRMVAEDQESARQNEVPEATFEEAPAAYREVTMAQVKTFTLAQFQFWSEDEFGRNFRKMVTLEQYRDPEIADWHQKIFTRGPVGYVEDMFREMMTKGVLRQSNPRLSALHYFAPFYLLLGMTDTPVDGEKAIDLLTKHIDDFIKNNTLDKEI